MYSGHMTDNENKLDAMRKSLKEVDHKFDCLWVSLYWLNLLRQEIYYSASSIHNSSVKLLLLRYKSSELIRKGGASLSLTCQLPLCLLV